MHSAAEPQLALEDAGNDSASRKAQPSLGALSENNNNTFTWSGPSGLVGCTGNQPEG
jgi:hypothetical protein